MPCRSMEWNSDRSNTIRSSANRVRQDSGKSLRRCGRFFTADTAHAPRRTLTSHRHPTGNSSIRRPKCVESRETLQACGGPISPDRGRRFLGRRRPSRRPAARAVFRLWNKSAAAGCGDRRPPKTLAFWGVAQVGFVRPRPRAGVHGGLFPRAVWHGSCLQSGVPSRPGSSGSSSVAGSAAEPGGESAAVSEAERSTGGSSSICPRPKACRNRRVVT